MKRRRNQKVAVEQSDDVDDGADQMSDPDPENDDFFHDAVDKFHAERDKVLLDGRADMEPADFSSDEEEVLGLGSESDEDDEEINEYERRLQSLRSKGFKEQLGSDLEDEAEDDEEGVNKAWGKSASRFYGGEDSDDVGSSDSDVDAAALEEKEALAIQKKLAAELEESDIGLEVFKPAAKKSEDTKEEEVKITKDLSKLSKKEKMKLLKKESPELLELIDDYKSKLEELENVLLPIHTLIVNKKLPQSKGAEFIKSKLQLYLNYCVNLSFYLMLKAKQSPVQNHPVVNRLVQYRNLIKQIDEVGDKMSNEINFILMKMKNKEDIPIKEPEESDRLDMSKFIQGRKKTKSAVASKAKKTKKKEIVEDDEEAEDADEDMTEPPTGSRSWGRKRKAGAETREEMEQALEFYRMMKKEGKKAKADHEEAVNEDYGDEDMESANEEDGEERRAIDYQIAKNKGLTRQRKKENRNPRVRYKMRFKDAVKRRKGQVRPIRKQDAPYAGELSGIRAGVTKSTKFHD